MITMIVSYLGTAAGGAIIKGVFGLISDYLDDKRQEKQALIDAAARRENAHLNKFQNADNYTKHTRRILAWGLCFTYCAILALWATFPQVPIATFLAPEGANEVGHGVKVLGFTLLGVETPGDLADRVITVTTGHLIVANSYVLTFILSAYFMPTGRK